jgi:hypothetical protein
VGSKDTGSKFEPFSSRSHLALSSGSSATLLHNITHLIIINIIIIIIIIIIITHKSIWRPNTLITLSVPLYQVKVTMGTAKEPMPDMNVITIVYQTGR